MRTIVIAAALLTLASCGTRQATTDTPAGPAVLAQWDAYTDHVQPPLAALMGQAPMPIGVYSPSDHACWASCADPSHPTTREQAVLAALEAHRASHPAQRWAVYDGFPLAPEPQAHLGQ